MPLPPFLPFSTILQQLLESCFEKVGTPGLYLGSGAILSAFSTGRVNSLVIDIGAAGTKITPIVEGYELKKASVYTSRGGNLLDDLLLQDIQLRTNRPLKPWFECTKSVLSSVGNNASMTTSFREIHIRDVVRDVKAYMCFVPHNPIQTTGDMHDPAALHKHREEELIKRGLAFPTPYELPDGTLVASGDSICTAPEVVFFPMHGSSSGGGGSGSSALRKRTRDMIDATFSDTHSNTSDMEVDNHSSTSNAHTANSTTTTTTTTSNTNTTSMYTPGSLMHKLGSKADSEALTDLVYACVAQADVDVRKDLLANIQIVGGGALIQGLSNRLQFELSGVVPSHMKVPVFSFCTLVNGIV